MRSSHDSGGGGGGPTFGGSGKTAPGRSTNPAEIARLLDDVCIYILRTRQEIEAKEGEPGFKLVQFSPPVSEGQGFIGGSRYGPFTVSEARRGFRHLHELGLIERTSYDPETHETTYSWTDLGRAVAAML